MAERRLYWDKEDEVMYDEIRHSSGPFKGINLIDLFGIALVYGKQRGIRTPIGKGSTGRMIEATVRNSDIFYLMMAIAVEETGSIDVLIDKDEYFTIAEEYAKTGIKILYNEYKELGNGILDDMELDLIEFLEENVEESWF